LLISYSILLCSAQLFPFTQSLRRIDRIKSMSCLFVHILF
jgi:hypothetical protein